MPEEPKAVSKSVSLLPQLWERVEGKAATDYGGNRSSYFRSLAEADLEDAAAGADGLIKLARRHHPGLVGELQSLCYETDGVTPRISQSKLISRLLEATAIALRAQSEGEKRMQTAPSSAIQAELTRLRTIEDAFFQIAASIAAVAPGADPKLTLRGGSFPFSGHMLNEPPIDSHHEESRPRRPIKPRPHGAGPDAVISKPA